MGVRTKKHKVKVAKLFFPFKEKVTVFTEKTMILQHVGADGKSLWDCSVRKLQKIGRKDEGIDAEAFDGSFLTPDSVCAEMYLEICRKSSEGDSWEKEELKEFVVNRLARAVKPSGNLTAKECVLRDCFGENIASDENKSGFRRKDPLQI